MEFHSVNRCSFLKTDSISLNLSSLPQSKKIQGPITRDIKIYGFRELEEDWIMLIQYNHNHFYAFKKKMWSRDNVGYANGKSETL